MKRIIFFTLTKFNKRDYNRFGVEIFIKRGYAIEFWDFSALFQRDYYKNYFPPDSYNYSGSIIIETLDQAKKKLIKLNENDIIIDSYQLLSNQEFKINNKCLVGAHLLGLIPEIEESRSLFSRLFNLLQKPLHTFKIIKQHFEGAFKKKQALDFLIVGGSNYKNDKNFLINDNTKIIEAHSFDYDRYKEENNNEENLFTNPTIVFLDEDIVFHPDYLKRETKSFVSFENYYPAMNDFFEKIEKSFNFEIIISLHPRANLSKSKDYFNGRKVIIGNTPSLIKQSKFVIAHSSASLKLAVLFQKPIIHIDSNHFHYSLRNLINIFSKELGSQIVNISNDFSINLDDIIIDEKKYKLFKTNYIKDIHASEDEKFIWDIFCDYLDKVN